MGGEDYLVDVINTLSSFGDRTTGSTGAAKSSQFIQEEFRNLGFDLTGIHSFSLPSRQKTVSRIIHVNSGRSVDIDPFISNAISPDTISVPGIHGPVIYAGSGDLKQFNSKTVQGAVVLMELDSSKNWINALSLGAGALIYIQRHGTDRFDFQDKTELSPVKFPRFVIPAERAKAFFGDFEDPGFSEDHFQVKLVSDLAWKNVDAGNIYCMVPGKGRTLKDELIVVEGFYDTSGFVAGRSPGADQACSIATLLDLARFLKVNPPERSVLLIATSGHGSSLYGMREFIWSIREKSKSLKKIGSGFEQTIQAGKSAIELLESVIVGNGMKHQDFVNVKRHVSDDIKTRVDKLSSRLMQLRLGSSSHENDALIKTLANKRMALKQLDWKHDLKSLSNNEIRLLQGLVPESMERFKRKLADAQKQLDHHNSALALRSIVESKSIQLLVSLHLSSHGRGVGAFNRGWLYPLKETINHYAPYALVDSVLARAGDAASKQLGLPGIYQDTLRPSIHRSWRSYFLDTPSLGGEVSGLAGFLGVSFVTTQDARSLWGTPGDLPQTVDFKNAGNQSRFISLLTGALASGEKLVGRRLPKNGFSTIKGRANFIRHGDLFADKPAPGSVILSFQGPGIYYSMVDESGGFFIKGVADKKHSLHKVIIEGYKFDSNTGDTVWAVDKKRTTKARYRVKVNKRQTETDLVMFECRQSTILNLLEPRTFQYMTKIQLFDARLEAPPVRYWFSRIDTRSSIISSLFFEPGTRFKLTLSDTLLTKKLILTNADDRHPEGTGYLIDDNPVVAPTQYLAAHDMWALLNPRIANLETNGINDRKIKDLRDQGNDSLDDAGHHLERKNYDRFFQAAGTSLALAGRVYDHVETIQKDVLFGVLFYIALFIPFAFCLERFAFAFRNIYKRIAGFLSILVVLIAVIYKIHPAFELAYSPMVVILAFFILGLSVMVAWIIFYRFEEEMKRVRQQGIQSSNSEISFFKAFSASFFIGVNNLRRRKMRTVLTCTTLIILTFTIMSFTSVKTVRQHSRLSYNDISPYHGLLVKRINWKGLPQQAFNILENSLPEHMTGAPRSWLETGTRTETVNIPVSHEKNSSQANALLGLSHKEPEISGLDQLLTRGRWFSSKDRYCVILPEQMAETLGIRDIESGDSEITLWSIPFKVIGTFSGQAVDKFKDLDGEPLTPVVFRDELFQQTTEAEMDAMESGQDVKAFQSRYVHIPFDQTLIIPHDLLVSMGGSLKSVAFNYTRTSGFHETVSKMIDRFGLWVFSGERDGVSVYSASDSLNYSGVPTIIIPLLISMFIVLNTMIGSVYERKREIGIYTSVGMAPSHVSILFIAEAMAYAVLSVVLGYVLAQVIATGFAGTAFFQGITVNYSSLSGVFAMVLVMIVVLLSSIYPSRMASSIAIPDVEKAWKMSIPEGNHINVMLPFLMKTGEETSAGGFLYDFFSSHQEISHGVFSVEDIRVEDSGVPAAIEGDLDRDRLPKGFSINFKAWLAPFDLGVMQDVRIRFRRSSSQKGYMEISMALYRHSGELNTWWRVNRRFVNLTRKQLLIWRSLDGESARSYEVLMNTHGNTSGESNG